MNEFPHSRTRRICYGDGLRLRPLAACLALAFSASTPGAGSDGSAQNPLAVVGGRHGAHFARAASSIASVTFHVNTCDDPLPVASTCGESIDGTIRQGFLCAQNNDAIDLTQLACSTITLSAPLVSSGAGSLILYGPGPDKLTIDATGKFRAMVHNANEYYGLYINDLTIANGRYETAGTYSVGGCISSNGNVFVSDGVISSCYVSGPGFAEGGGIFADGKVSLYHSSVTGNTAHSYGGGYAFGGGIEASYVALNRSTVSGNTASYTGTGRAVAGGIDAYFSVRADSSTISGNAAATEKAGIDTAYANLFNSTVSGNHADHGPVGGVYARKQAQIFNSTIVANTGKGAFAAGLYGKFATSPSSFVQSTIIANNTASGVELDAGSAFGFAIAGANNLIMSLQDGTRVPFDTIVEDPLLGPLQDNGGPTATHALLPGSPAIDKGSSGAPFDQRGFARDVGLQPDIGAFEFDPDRIFGNGFNL